MDWITGQHQLNPTLPAVANVSLGVNEEGFAIENAVTNSMFAGVTYVAAAGNENQDARVWSPQNVDRVIVVGGTDSAGARWPTSNWGPGVDLFAPGGRMPSALTGNGLPLPGCFWNGSNTSTCLDSGTSYAAGLVSGVVAMYLQNRPGTVACGANLIQGPAPASGNLSSCPDRVARFVKANARIDILTNVNGTLPSPNRFISSASIVGPANPLDNHRFFVWSQYVDFLNREPDSIGFNNWTSNLTLCGSDWNCINNQRIHTVRGMIESGEFRNGKPALSNPTSADQYNREYVRQLYLCLLRREPDTGGFTTYVNELNSTGNYDHTVHGFINSSEYRRRFGPQ
jgi:subtilisin family serine protease